MANLKVTIDLDNDAFIGTNHEAARLLRELADTLEVSGWADYGKLIDVNGNSVGDWEVTRG